MHPTHQKEYSFSLLILFMFFVILGGIIYLTVMSFQSDTYRQGVTGTLLIRPLNCVPDPQRPGECQRRLTIGKGEIIVREHNQEQEGAPASGTIVKRFESKLDGSFRVGLPEGTYCFSTGDDLCHVITVSPLEWQQITLQPFDE